MKWWKWPLILTIIWLVIIIVTGVIHTEVILKDKITKQQDDTISREYDRAFATGALVIWVIAYIMGRRKRNR